MFKWEDSKHRTITTTIIAKRMRSFPVKADVAHEVHAGMDSQTAVLEQMYLHLVVPVTLFLLVPLDLQHFEIPPIGLYRTIQQSLAVTTKLLRIQGQEVQVKALPGPGPRSPGTGNHVMRKVI